MPGSDWRVVPDVVEYHRSLLEDRERTEAFRRAIDKTVRPGHRVVDVGTGSGVLAVFACRAGAAHVYAIDDGLIGEVAAQVFEANGVSDRVTLVRSHSTRAQLPEPVDVVVSETLWNFGIGEGILATLADARTRFLRTGGTIVPQSITLFAAAVESSSAYARIGGWDFPDDLDVSPARRIAASSIHRVTFTPEELLGEAEPLTTLDLRVPPPKAVVGRADVLIRRDGLLHGAAGWFSSELATDVTVTNAPPNQTPSWKHAFFPLADPVPVKSGQIVRIQIGCSATEDDWRWSVGQSG